MFDSDVESVCNTLTEFCYRFCIISVRILFFVSISISLWDYNFSFSSVSVFKIISVFVLLTVNRNHYFYFQFSLTKISLQCIFIPANSVYFIYFSGFLDILLNKYRKSVCYALVVFCLCYVTLCNVYTKA